jgi:integrase/recombinase XerD
MFSFHDMKRLTDIRNEVCNKLQQRKLPYKKEVLPRCVINFLNYLPAMRGCSDNTLIAYSSDLILFFKYIKTDRGLVNPNTDFNQIDIRDIDNTLLSSITEEDLMAFINWTIYERNNSEKTRARKIACLKSFFRYLHKKAKVIENNPAVDLESPKIGKRKPIFLTYEESLKLLESINSRNAIRDNCIITLFLNCGIRLSELCNINLMDIKGDTLSVVGKGNKERVIPLNEVCLEAINRYLPIRQKMLEINNTTDSDDASKALFLSERKKRISQRTVQELVEKYVKKATQIYVHLSDDHVRTAVTANPLSKRK